MTQQRLPVDGVGRTRLHLNIGVTAHRDLVEAEIPRLRAECRAFFEELQRTFPFRMLEYGDPDNTGRDLAGHNEILFRAEVIFAWYVFVDQFAVIEDLV